MDNQSAGNEHWQAGRQMSVARLIMDSKTDE